MVIEKLAEVLPIHLFNQIEPHIDKDVIEIALDLNRPVVLNTLSSYKILPNIICNNATLDYIIKSEKVGVFGNDNRAGVQDTLHRLSIIKDKNERIIGLTFRFGQEITGNIGLIQDLIDTNKNILFIGAPGKGKTTFLRETCKYLSNDMKKRVVIVDTSNEIAGDSIVPHSAVGNSRRLMVPKVKVQADIMVEAVKNHTPQVLVIDEISTIQEAKSAKVIAERGVQLIATAHGETLANAINNDPINILVGGITTVTISDKEAEKRNCSKQILSRNSMPTFDIIIEMIDFNTIAVHHNVAQSIDCLISDNGEVTPEIRVLSEGKVIYESEYACRFE